jgi:hypothetical protein
MTHTGTNFLVLGNFSPWPPFEQSLINPSYGIPS